MIYQEKVDRPGPAEIAAISREAIGTKEAGFCVSADIEVAGEGWHFGEAWRLAHVLDQGCEGEQVCGTRKGLLRIFGTVGLHISVDHMAQTTVGRLPDTIIFTLEYIEAELGKESYLVSTKKPVVLPGERFRTDGKCTDDHVVLASWEMETGRWFSLKLDSSQVPCLFKPGGGSQWASTSAELLATLAAPQAFGWLSPCKERKTLDVIFAGTDNSAKELSQGLRWRPREQNTEADQLTNEDFTGFAEDLRVQISLDDIDLKILNALVKTRNGFVEARDQQKLLAKKDTEKAKKRFDKTSW
eukprot:s205_g18.t1